MRGLPPSAGTGGGRRFLIRGRREGAEGERRDGRGRGDGQQRLFWRNINERRGRPRRSFIPGKTNKHLFFKVSPPRRCGRGGISGILAPVSETVNIEKNALKNASFDLRPELKLGAFMSVSDASRELTQLNPDPSQAPPSGVKIQSRFPVARGEGGVFTRLFLVGDGDKGRTSSAPAPSHLAGPPPTDAPQLHVGERGGVGGAVLHLAWVKFSLNLDGAVSARALHRLPTAGVLNYGWKPNAFIELFYERGGPHAALAGSCPDTGTIHFFQLQKKKAGPTTVSVHVLASRPFGLKTSPSQGFYGPETL